MTIKNFINACLFSWDRISIVQGSIDPRDDEVTPIGVYLYVKDIPDKVWETTIDNWDIICTTDNDGSEITTICIQI